ncbi:hypothetical protein M9H77_05095 [Catharanthus roseus]|uniref:Uncharacterized protein n=1 Tax=Catharanthus roseus TaxID=4058 RepID=A0ACC0CG88_CATRO|nr:hypothetical protein M9H77_05095 [Catharanthus roseus]
MVMFSTFEHSVDLLHRKIMQRRKEDCSKVQQLGVTCLAGSVGSIISNPADNIVASLNNKKANSLKQVISINDILAYHSSQMQILSFHPLLPTEYPRLSGELGLLICLQEVFQLGFCYLGL